jgi:hypothetical protein
MSLAEKKNGISWQQSQGMVIKWSNWNSLRDFEKLHGDFQNS